MNATELKNKFSETGLIINGGALSIWNIPFGKMGDNFYKINKIENDEVENILNIETEYPKLKIWNPTNIIEAEAKVRGLYEGKLKFPTIIVGNDYIKNPTISQLEEFLKIHNISG